jgi:thiol:disulfide interchange protein DsbD
MNKKYFSFKKYGRAVVMPAAVMLAALLWPLLSHSEKDFSSWSKYSQATLISETTVVAPGHPATLGIKINLADKWHTYWVNPGDSGTAIRLKFAADPAIKLKRVLFPIPERLMAGPLISFGYSHEVLLPVEVQIDASARVGQNLPLTVDAEWLVCEDVCIPAITQLKLDVPVGRLEDVKPGADFALFQTTRALLPEPQAEYPKFQFSDLDTTLSLPPIPEEEEYVDFFPFRGSGVTNSSPRLDGGTLHFEKSNVPVANPERVGLLVLKLKANGQRRALQFGDGGWSFTSKGAGTAPVKGLWWMLLSAFLGGLILNLMPCVFPILSMKLLGLLKLGKAHAREVRAQNLAYSAGVVLSFLAIASVLSLLRTTGQWIGWGFQLQSPVFLALLIWLFFALTLNLLGLYEIEFINSGWGGRLTRSRGWLGSFFTGVLAVIVASPCTAPFMGAALGFGLSQPLPVLFAIFFLLGLGLAFPYLLFVIFPSLTWHLPKPGEWMNQLKQVMALPMFATALWLLWVLKQVSGLSSVLAVAVGAAVITVAIGWLSARARSASRLLVALSLAFAVAYIYSADLKAKQNNVAQVEDGDWQPYSETALAALKGKNVFVNMTADWCLTCKVNERLVFTNPEVRALLDAKSVTLVKGDWTQQNEEITRFLNRYNRVGVPFYVLYSSAHPDGVTLPEVLTKSSFVEFINKEFP